MALAFLWAVPWSASAQTIIRTGSSGLQPNMPPMPSSPGGPSDSSGRGGSGGGPWVPSDPLTAGSYTNGYPTNEIELSFQGLQIEQVVQWLAKNTGKTIMKSSKVQGQLTVASSKKVPIREALNSIYRALALEGFSVVETTTTIMIVPADQEPKMGAELVTGAMPGIPEGRQLLQKVFDLKHGLASDIQGRLRSALSSKGSIDVDDRANRLIVTDYNDNLRIIGELIDALDLEHPEDLTVRVEPLKNVNAMELARELTPLYQSMKNKSPKDSIDLTADDRSNALLVLGNKVSFDAFHNLIQSLDTEQAQEKVTHTFMLTNADAQDVAKQLQDLGAGPGNSGSGYPGVILISYPSGNNQRNGKQPTYVPDRRRNAVIVQAPAVMMDSISNIVAELDQPVGDESLAPTIYRCKYANATDIEDVLNELFLKKQQQTSIYDILYGNGESTPQADRDVGRLYGKVRITSEPYSNTIIITSNSKESLDAVLSVIQDLDKPTEAGDSTLRVPLRFGKAPAVANQLNILFAKNGSPLLRSAGQPNQPNQNPNPQQQQGQSGNTTQDAYNLTEENKQDGYYPWLGGQPDPTGTSANRGAARPISDLVGRVRAVADERINTVLITSSIHYFPEILRLVNELDTASDSVMIEARIVEVSSDFLDQLGVRYSPDGSKVFTPDDYDNSLLIHNSGQYNQGVGGNSAVNNPTGGAISQNSSPAVINTLPAVLTQLRSGVINSSVNIDYLIQFLHKTTDATVLGEPQITIDDNEMGRLFVGQEVPVPANSSLTQLGNANTQITYKNVGVTLEITAHINTSGDVQLKIHAESSTVVPGQTVLGGAVFDTRNFRTDLTAKDGETRVLGGIIQRQISNTVRKTPFFGSIPILGWAFKNKNKTTHEVELMVFLRPKVVHAPQDAKAMLNDIYKSHPRLMEVEQDAPSQKPTPKKK